jgi:hypothetical protein
MAVKHAIVEIDEAQCRAIHPSMLHS